MIIYSQFIKKSQENISLNIEGILYLKNFVKNRPPVYRGQEPMFAGPEMDEYHFLKQNLKLKDILVLESLFVNMLKELGSNIEKFEPIDDINDDEIEEHIYHMLDSSVDLEFFEQEIPDFLLSEIEGEEAKYLIDCLETMSNEIKWHEIRYNNKEEFKKVYQNIIGNFQKHIDYLEENDKLIIERTKTILKPLQQNYQNYINNSEYYEINFFDHQENNLSKLLYELLKGIVTDIIDTQENYEHEEKTLNRIIENIKSLLHPLDEYLNILTSIGNDVKGWIYTIVNDKLHNELIDYYIREHGDSLRKEAEESIYENMQEKIKENDIIPSGFGNPPENENSSWWSHIGLAEFISSQNVLENIKSLEDFANTYDTNVFNVFKNATLDNYLDFARILDKELFYLNNSDSAYSSILANVYQIYDFVENNQVLKYIFNDDINNIDLNENEIDNATNHIEQNIDTFKTIIENTENESSLLKNLKKIKETKKRKEKEKQEFLNKIYNQGFYTKEDLIKLKELGIKKPLEMSYQTDPKGFPGKGQFISESHNKIPFQITMYPPENQDFPTSMYESFEYHKLPRQNDKIGIGWIGGYIDPIKKIMYIAEIQSDLLQRTMEMIDPEKSKEVHKQELEQVKNKINNLMNFNPEERIKKLEDKINRTDPNHPAYQNMLNALNEMKENPQSQVNQQQLQKLQNRMKELESLINKPSGSKGIRNQREFHQYKSKVENYYKDWISIFFNTLLREGKRLRIQKVLIVSPQTLIKKWRQYAKPQTIKLFERIYQAMAEKQGAKLNNGWYELNISEAKFAMNWYKIYKKANFQIDFWRQHLDIYMKIYMKKMNEYYEEEDLNAEWRQSLEEEDSQENQLKKEAFEEWLKEVPNQLKLPNGELVPEFKREVRAYVNSEYGFDPFPYEDENHNLDDYIPSVEELEEQWSM